jgi:FixJ family two-component response regulator
MVYMVMPGLSGTDVLAALRRAGLTVPVILISGQIIVREGFSGVLSKPFKLRRFSEVVAAAVDHRRTTAGSTRGPARPDRCRRRAPGGLLNQKPITTLLTDRYASAPTCPVRKP